MSKNQTLRKAFSKELIKRFTTINSLDTGCMLANFQAVGCGDLGLE